MYKFCQIWNCLTHREAGVAFFLGRREYLLWYDFSSNPWYCWLICIAPILFPVLLSRALLLDPFKFYLLVGVCQELWYYSFVYVFPFYGYELLTSYPCFLVARFMLPFGLIFFGACCILDDECFGRIQDLWFTYSCVLLLSGIQACVQ